MRMPVNAFVGVDGLQRLSEKVLPLLAEVLSDRELKILKIWWGLEKPPAGESLLGAIEALGASLQSIRELEERVGLVAGAILRVAVLEILDAE